MDLKQTKLEQLIWEILGGIHKWRGGGGEGAHT